MRNLLGNVRYALRQFRSSPVYAGAAVLTLALGIGGTTAIFTLMDAVMLRSLPVTDPASLYRIGEGDDCCVEGGPQDRWGLFSFQLSERLKAETPEFEAVTAFQAGRGRLSVRREGSGAGGAGAGGEAAARPLRSEYVDGSFFDVLGVKARAGRVFTTDDDRPAAAPVAVLSHRAWQTTYAGDPSVIGAHFFIEGKPFTVIGVTPAGFFGETLESDPPDIWIPLQQEPMMRGDGAILHQENSAWLRMIGRLRPGASIDGMSARLTASLRQWIQHDANYPANWMPGILRKLDQQALNVVPAGAGVAVMKEEFGRSLRVLLSVCGVVLLIACANVANLLLARAAARRGQTAIRRALGATAGQLVGEALTESILLALAGGVLGLVVAMWAAHLLLVLAFREAGFLPIETSPSLLVLGFGFAVSVLTGVIFGAAPAWFATRTDPTEALRASTRTTHDHSSFARKALLIVQAAASVVLIAVAAMLARSLDRLKGMDFGYPIDGRVLVSLHRPSGGDSLADLAALHRQMEQRLDAIPGVQAAGLALYNPLTDNWGEMVLVSGHPAPGPDDEAGASWNRVSAGYLQSLGVPLLRGRMFTEADNETAAPVAVVNEAFVKRFFKNGEDPLEQHFGLDMPQYADTFRIVGVVHDARFAGWGLHRPAFPMFYVPLAQRVDYQDDSMKRLELVSHNMGGLLLVTRQSPGALQPLLTRVLSDLDPNMTITGIRTLRHQVELMFDEERAVASLAGLFGAVALILAAIGLYAVTAYSVARRTSEIGIRMALGSDRSRVVRTVMASALGQVSLGLVLGLPLAIGAGWLISTELYGIDPWDPPALGLAAIALGIGSCVAGVIPAARAASISPVIALRAE
jgi:predicted permease